MKGRSLTRVAWALALTAVLGTAARTHADSLPMRGLADSRIRTVLYSPDEVYRLYGFVGYHLDLEFASDEVFVGLSAGDPEAVTYSAHENVLTLRPKAASSQMNLTVSTTKRRYYFEYTHRGAPSQPLCGGGDVRGALHVSRESGGPRIVDSRAARRARSGARAEEPTQERRLLVLRERPNQTDRGIRRWRPYALDVRREGGTSGHLRAKR